MASPLTYIIDTLRFDVYVNCSSSSNQSTPTKVHPWLTLCMEPVSRRVLASYLSEHRPNLESIKAILYEAFFADDENKHSTSLPDEIWCDAGIGFPSLQSLTQMLQIPLCSAPLPAKGLIERLFLHIQNACIPACSPGQDGSGTNFIAENTLSELEERFVQFLLHYHHQIQPSTGLTPLESWQEQCRPSAFDSHILYLLLQDGGERRVVKDGIHYRKNLYWHSDLALYVGKEVSIRMKPTQSLPETIGVFFERQWICSAFLQEGANEDHLCNENERI